MRMPSRESLERLTSCRVSDGIPKFKGSNETGGHPDFERELVETFVSSGDKCLAEILSAYRTNDFETIGKRAHALKGASANIHAAGLAAAASSLESAARTNSTGEIDGLLQQLSEKLQAVNAELRKAG